VSTNLESTPESPERWAEGQLDLGTALRDQGLRTESAKGTKLLAQAVMVKECARYQTTQQKMKRQAGTVPLMIQCFLLQEMKA